jgi:HK97 family phage major capsid protein
MGAASMTGPRVNVEQATNVSGVSPTVGGINFVWGSEQLPPETEPLFAAVELKAWDLLGFAVMSNQEFWDITSAAIAADADQLLYKLLGRAAAWKAEYSFLQGTGTSQQMPLGILNAPGTLKFSRSTTAGDGANKIGVKDISGMAGMLLPYSWRNAIWMCSPSALPQIAAVPSFSVNRPVTDEFKGSVGALLTRPLFVTERLPPYAPTGSDATGDLILIDPSLYVIGDRQQVLIDVSEHPNFRSAQTLLRVWLRLDGKPLNSAPITLQDQITKVAPFVVLAP